MKKISDIIYEQGVSLRCICTLVIGENGTPLSFTISSEKDEREGITRFKRETEKVVIKKRLLHYNILHFKYLLIKFKANY